MLVTSLPEAVQAALVDIYDHRYNFDSLALQNESGVTATLTQERLLGQPVACSATEADLLDVVGEATANGIIVDAPVAGITGIVDTADCLVDVLVLRRGPALYRKSGLEATDAAGATFTVATLLTALEDEGVKFLDEETVQETQTT